MLTVRAVLLCIAALCFDGALFFDAGWL